VAVQYPWDLPPAPVATPPRPDAPPRKPKPRGRRPAVMPSPWHRTGTAPAWLYHHLTINGPSETVAAFAAAARGSGVIPWRLDLPGIEEDVFNLAASQPAGQRNLTIAGCRILARQFRGRVEAHHAKAAALVGCSQACPFDLQALLPVPAVILQLGPAHPDALAWLAAQ